MRVRSATVFLLATIISATAFSRLQAQAPAWAKVSPAQAAAAKKLGVPVAFENSVGMRFVLIPPGKFMMGSKATTMEVAKLCNMPNAQAGWFQDEHPRHEVTLTGAFYMSIHELSQEAYEAVTYPKPADDKKEKKEIKKLTDDFTEGFKGAKLPIVRISFDHANKFCQSLGGLEAEKGRKYFLPTEAQWEYACRAGTETPFSFGEAASTKQANYHGDYTYGDGKKGENREKPVPVGSLPANPWGLHEMHGNAAEWCAEWYSPYSAAAATDPKGPEKGNQRVLRGGSWRSYPGACRSAFRLGNSAGTSSYNIGFRVCCSLPAEPEPESK